MQVLLRRDFPGRPKVTLVLLDWSCRESLHMLDYLAEQSVPRDQFEILWIEYYDRQLEEMRSRIEAAQSAGRPLPVDAWVLMQMPRGAYYHKHLMYNLGILLARGEIVCLCDSDTMVGPEFVQTIIEQFERDPEIVLHHDEVRNSSDEFYPFRYPAFEEVRGPGCSPMIDGRTAGIWDHVDGLHTRNYGACFSARREDLIAIGGADMHIDYLGHICGPYEMTFRLMNMGRREIWHPTEYLYHTWHPGQAGENNYLGPHDGRQVSLTALEARQTGRVLPLVESSAIARLRTQPGPHDEAALLAELFDPNWLEQWKPENLSSRQSATSIGWRRITVHESTRSLRLSRWKKRLHPYQKALGWPNKFRILPGVGRLLLRQTLLRRDAWRPAHRRAGEGVPSRTRTLRGAARSAVRRFKELATFVRQMWRENKYTVRQCWFHLNYMAERGEREAALYGDGEIARILLQLAPSAGIRIKGICPEEPGLCPRAQEVETWTSEQLAEYEGPVIVASLTRVSERAGALKRMGFDRSRVVVMR
jgi:hypothetical protein